MRRLRLGIIGTGVAARILHWPALAQLSDRYEIVAVANRSRDKGEAFAEMAGLPRSEVHDDYRDLLRRGDLDVVDLILPPALNYEVARAAAEAGIAVICEKPIATTIEEATAIAALPEKFGVQVLVAENFRYDNAVRRAREMIDDGQVAPPFMMSYQWMQPVAPDDEIASRPWRQAPAHAGGFLSDHGIHMIDVARFLMGDVRAVQVWAAHLRDYLGGYDTAVYNLKFDSGALGSIQWSFAIATQQTSRIELWSDDGSLVIGPWTVCLQRRNEPEKRFSTAGPSSFVNEFADFYDVLVHGKTPHMTLRDAQKDLEVVIAAHRSAVTNQVELVEAQEQQP